MLNKFPSPRYGLVISGTDFDGSCVCQAQVKVNYVRRFFVHHCDEFGPEAEPDNFQSYASSSCLLSKVSIFSFLPNVNKKFNLVGQRESSSANLITMGRRDVTGLSLRVNLKTMMTSGNSM